MNIRAILAGLVIGAGFAAYAQVERYGSLKLAYWLVDLHDPDVIIPAILMIVITAAIVAAVHHDIAKQNAETRELRAYIEKRKRERQ